jgi:hypothetical protein
MVAEQKSTWYVSVETFIVVQASSESEAVVEAKRILPEMLAQDALVLTAEEEGEA